MAPIALAAAAGIAADRLGAGPETIAWGGIALVASIAALLGSRGSGRVARPAILAACAAIGGGWHHFWWSDLAGDDLARSAPDRPEPCWVRGTILEDPVFREGTSAGDRGASRLVLGVTGISDGRTWQAASGRLLAFVSGGRVDLRAGEPVQAAGTLARIAGPSNPGEEDTRERWRAEQIRLRIAIDEPAALWLDPEGEPSPIRRVLGRLRAWSRSKLVGPLDDRVAPLASALLLGNREGVDPDVNDAFARTGTAHLLAISGAHLQVLALAIWFGFRALKIGRTPALLAVMASTIVYAILVGLMPSVVRSAIMTVLAGAAGLKARCRGPSNMLATAALGTLLWDPTDLFDAGCQLSFLGVAALLWGVPAAIGSAGRPVDPIDRLIRQYEPRWKSAIRFAGVWISRSVAASAVVWLATAPLVADRFHVVSPIAVLLNLPLVPLTSISLLLAGLTLVGSAAWPPLAVAPAAGCEACLRWTESIVRWGAAQTWGHRFVAGPSIAWTATFYLVLALAVWSGARRSRLRRPTRAALVGWVGLGIFGAIAPARPPENPEAEILAVGHGLATILRSESGRTLLYDSGRMGDPRMGRRIVAPALWAKGVGRIDLVVLSHADSDHYNGLPDVLDRFPIGAVLIPPGFGGPKNPEADRLLADLRDRGVDVRPGVAGDRIDLGPGLEIRAIHPPEGWLPASGDNDRSVVLDVEQSGRRLLLTGDLDGAGLAEILARPIRPVDAFLAPHHGGRSANPGWLYDWARPSAVLVSQRPPAPGVKDALSAVESRGIPVLRTWDRGAISVRWLASGLDLTGFLDPKVAAPAGFVGAWPSESWISILLGIAGFVAGLAVCLGLTVVEWGAWTLLRPGRRWASSAPEPPPWEPISAEAADGSALSGGFLANPIAGGRTLALLHGFAEDRSALLDRALAIHRIGWNVALLDSRSKGLSGGDSCTFGGLETGDFLLWVDVLADRVGPSMRLAAWGRSMGAVVALRASVSEPRLLALVLEAPFVGLSDSVAASLRRLRLPSFFARLILLRARSIAGVSLDSPRPIDVAPSVAAPVLMLQGTADATVSLDDARRLASKFSGSVDWIEVEGAGHANVVDVGGSALLDRVAAFLDRAVPIA